MSITKILTYPFNKHIYTPSTRLSVPSTYIDDYGKKHWICNKFTFNNGDIEIIKKYLVDFNAAHLDKRIRGVMRTFGNRFSAPVLAFVPSLSDVYIVMFQHNQYNLMGSINNNNKTFKEHRLASYACNIDNYRVFSWAMFNGHHSDVNKLLQSLITSKHAKYRQKFTSYLETWIEVLNTKKYKIIYVILLCVHVKSSHIFYTRYVKTVYTYVAGDILPHIYYLIGQDMTVAHLTDEVY